MSNMVLIKVVALVMSYNKSNPKEFFEALRENNLNNNRNNSNGNDEMNLDEGLREIMRAIIQKAIEELNLLTKYMNYFHKKYLAYKNYVLMCKIYRWILERRALVEKMIEFEKKRIRSTSFFQNSFQLLEEEKEENLVGPI
ncbi:hypothetical protein Glove_206g17 [Diversispora epigaea]|uniref:Uncharacterized protein n=1 Tax=Diversispora epigaea TaxID=1348612 RepID=A0A397IJH2_9GLOM|nr:hypothetical protein Glove_206g17 [Diversispora epigaea]